MFRPVNSPFSYVNLVQFAALVLTALIPSHFVLAQGVSSPKSKVATSVGVTSEMTGAGIVSSGEVLPISPPVTGSRKLPVPSWGKPLPYPIMIADRRNNRLIEISPDKKVLWEFPSPSLKVYRGNEDVNFSSDGKLLAVSEEDNFDVHVVDFESRKLIWTYGTPDGRGKEHQQLNYPDDAHLLDDGNFLTADIRNCRVLFIDTKTNKVTTQWGTPGKCKHNPPQQLAHPNGATPLGNGDILITEITDARLTRMNRQGQTIWSASVPGLHYPSDAFPTVDGKQVVVADFWKPGRVVIFNPDTKKVIWEYFAKEGEKMLDHPSIARELPETGDILVVDDLNDRVIVIDRKTKEIIWQYGQAGKKGYTLGLLNYPDGVDIDVYRDWRKAK